MAIDSKVLIMWHACLCVCTCNYSQLAHLTMPHPLLPGPCSPHPLKSHPCESYPIVSWAHCCGLNHNLTLPISPKPDSLLPFNPAVSLSVVKKVLILNCTDVRGIYQRWPVSNSRSSINASLPPNYRWVFSPMENVFCTCLVRHLNYGHTKLS